MGGLTSDLVIRKREDGIYRLSERYSIFFCELSCSSVRLYPCLQLISGRSEKNSLMPMVSVLMDIEQNTKRALVEIQKFLSESHKNPPEKQRTSRITGGSIVTYDFNCTMATFDSVEINQESMKSNRVLERAL